MARWNMVTVDIDGNDSYPFAESHGGRLTMIQNYFQKASRG